MDVPGVALITGAASGIGRACAREFAFAGCRGLALVDLDLEGLEKVKEEILEEVQARNAKAPDVEIFSLDVSSEKDVDFTIGSACYRFGRIDYVVNVAGITAKPNGGVARAETDDWRRVMDVNLNGTFFVLRAAAKIMLKQEPLQSTLPSRAPQRGSIINFSSIQGLVGIGQWAAYVTSKTAVVGLTRSAADDYAKDGIRVNCICPGWTETPMTTGSPEVLEAMKQSVSTSVPMARMGKPEEIADGVLYLAGGRSSFVTGSALVVDGGYVSR